MSIKNIISCLSKLRSRRLCGILLASFVMAIALPVLNTFVIYPAFTSILTSSIEEDAQRLAKHTLPPSLRGIELTHESLNNRFFADIYKLEHDFDLLKIKVFSSTGEVLYSTEATDIGHLNTKPYFIDVIAKGYPYTKVVTKESKSAEDQTLPLDVVETYAPFMRGSTFLGAFELYYDITDRKERIDRLVTYSTLAMGSLSLFLLIAVIAMIKKETARIEAQERAEALKEDVERITKHDMKAPLTGVLSGIQYLENYSKLDEDQADMLNNMRETVNKGMDMVNRSLDLYKMEKGTYAYAPESSDLVGIARQIQTDLSHWAVASGVDVLLTRTGNALSEQDSLPFTVEEPLCYSLISNLLKNAIEASSSGDRVTVNLAGVDEFVITIHNPGVVPEEVRDTFFEKYATAGKKTGSGLGTYSAMLMAKTMGGTIEMTTSDRDGTLLTVTLPEAPINQPE